MRGSLLTRLIHKLQGLREASFFEGSISKLVPYLSFTRKCVSGFHQKP